jgi:hypothetical protein
LPNNRNRNQPAQNHTKEAQIMIKKKFLSRAQKKNFSTFSCETKYRCISLRKKEKEKKATL